MLILRSLILGILLLHLSHDTCGSEQIYFIKATEDSQCASQPCLTLNEFVHNTTKDVKASIILQFGAGNHTLGTRWITTNIEKCSMLSNDNNSIIVCNKLAAGFTFENMSLVTLANLTFIGCGNDSRFNAVLHISQVIHADVNMCIFLHSKGRVIEAARANITILSCMFENSRAGVFMAAYDVTLFDRGSVYVSNNASTVRSSLLYFNASIANFINSKFYKNLAEHATMVYVRGGGTLTLRQCELTRNNGEALVTSYRSTVKIYDSKLTHNYAMYGILLIKIHATNMSINNGIFSHNNAQVRTTVLYIRESHVESFHMLIITSNTSLRLGDNTIYI